MIEDDLHDETDDVFGESSQKITATSDICDTDPAHRTLRPRKSCEFSPPSNLAKKIRFMTRKTHRSADDESFLKQHEDVVKLMESRKTAYKKSKERAKELFDSNDVLHAKVDQLAHLFSSSKHVIVYTGAGISTSANIPDYRGVKGVWTQISSGQAIDIGLNPTHAVPTYTHMAISSLVATKMVKHVTSQNCDGLHIRSGVMSDHLSELHGNMYAEICSFCGKSYYRVFDVTEKTGLRRHKTERHCNLCKTQLKDTIVHFGELSESRWPHNWTAAEHHAEQCDLILCLGSSLKVLRSYKKLWLTERKKSLRPTLCIVNVQWTPKDSQARLKINGRTDDVLKLLMTKLSVTAPEYNRENDPLFQVSTPLQANERASYNTNCVLIPIKYQTEFVVEQTRWKEKMLSESVMFSEKLSHEDCNDVKTHSLDQSSNSHVPDVKDEQSHCHHNGVPSQHAVLDRAISSNDVPAWFGKGCRKMIKKRSKVKHRRLTN